MKPKRGLLLSRIVLAALRLREEFEATLAAKGIPLTPQAFEILRVLSSERPPTRAMLGRSLRVRPQSLQESLKTLESRALISRVSRAGKRFVFYELSEVGRELFARTLEAIGALEDHLFATVPLEDRAIVLDVIGYGAETANFDEALTWHPFYVLNRG